MLNRYQVLVCFVVFLYAVSRFMICDTYKDGWSLFVDPLFYVDLVLFPIQLEKSIVRAVFTIRLGEVLLSTLFIPAFYCIGHSFYRFNKNIEPIVDRVHIENVWRLVLSSLRIGVFVMLALLCLLALFPYYALFKGLYSGYMPT